MHWGRALSALLLVLILAGLTAADVPANAKKVTCKGSKVPVTIGKRTTCVPIAKALPKPKAVDIRVAYLREGLGFDLRRFGAAGKRAQAKMLKALPKALALIDRGRRRPGVSLLSGPIAYASACSPNGEASPVGKTDGLGISAYGDNGGQLQFNTGGLTFRTRFANCGKGTGFNVPDCPKASGEVKASGATESFEVTEEVLDGSEVIWRKNTNFETKRKASGKVAADAMLDYIVLEVAKETFIVATGGIVQRGTTTRHARIDMRTGKYDPADVSVTARGDAGANDSAESFASIADTAIRAFRYAETGGFGQEGWATFNRKAGAYCAEPIFSPASETLKLRKGKRDQLGIYAKAADGGRAAAAKWTLLAPVNADFAPSSTDGASPGISYTVTNAPRGGRVQVTVKFTSTAGVGQKTWTQPTEPDAVNHIEGTIGGETSLATAFGPPSVQKWSGTAKFDLLAGGVYLLGSGSVSIELSGTESSGATGCLQSGSAQAPLSSGTMNVTGVGAENGPPYDYSIQLSMPFVAVKGTRHSCPSGAEAWEGTQFDAVPLWGLNVAGEQSPDGLSFVGSESEGFGGLTQERHWTLFGKP